MSSSIYRYAVTDDPDDAPLFDSPDEAEEEAQRTGACVVTLEYEYTGSSVRVDHRPS